MKVQVGRRPSMQDEELINLLKDSESLRREAYLALKQECRKRRKHSQRRVPRFTQRRNSIASAVSSEKILGDAMPALSEVERALSRRNPI